MQLKVLYFCLGIGFYAIQAKNELPNSKKFSCTTADCLFAPDEPPEQEFKALTLEQETSKGKKPLCSDIDDMKKLMYRIGVDCVDDEEPTKQRSDSSCNTIECTYAESAKGFVVEPPSQPTTIDSKPLEEDQTLGQSKIGVKVPDPAPVADKELSKVQLPRCSDIQKAAASTPVQVGINCIGDVTDVVPTTPSDTCGTPPSQPPGQVQTLDYRWESYNGTPPNDAFQLHYEEYTEYIGQVEIPGAGTCMGKLWANEVEINVYCNGNLKKTDNIKILCVGHEEYYEWKEIRYNEEEFHAVVKDNELVKGGYNDTKKVDTFVGAYDGSPPLLIGNIDKEEGTFCFYDQGCRSVSDIRLFVLLYKPEEGRSRVKPDWET